MRVLFVKSIYAYKPQNKSNKSSKEKKMKKKTHASLNSKIGERIKAITTY